MKNKGQFLPMNIVVRYVFRNLGFSFLCAFTVFTLILLAGGLANEAISRHLPLIVVIRLIPFVFAETLSITLPATLLFAITSFFGKMSGNNEVIALKALGIPPRAFLLPVYAVAILISVITVKINDLTITKGQPAINAIIYSAAENILIEQLKDSHRFETDNKDIVILVKGVDDQRRLIQPTIIHKKEGATIEAKTAKISIDFTKELLTVTLIDFRATTREGGMFKAAGNERSVPISLTSFVPSAKSDRPADMGLSRIAEEQQKALEEMEQQRRIIAAHRAFGASMGSVDAWAEQPTNDAKEKMRSLLTHYNRLLVEPQRRWAAGFCCFFFVWFGAPVAIWMRRTDFFSGLFACFIPILLFYYPWFTFGTSQAKDGSLPPMSVWIANVLVIPVGYWFWRKIHRY